MKTNIEHATQRSILRLEGRMGSGAFSRFRDAYRQAIADCSGRELALDMTEVDHIDSSAMGMLLLLQQDAVKRGIAVTLAGTQPYVQKTLRTAQFDRLFAFA